MNPKLAAFLSSWLWDPGIIVGLLLGAGLYAAGWWRLSRRGRGRAAPPRWRAACYAGGLLTVGLALLSPIAAYDELFFFLHMTQHLMLMIVAPVLLLLGAPLLPTLWGLPYEVRRGVGRLFAPQSPLARAFHALTNPLVAVAINLIVVGVWHIPAFYDAAQGRSFTHDLEHFMFFGSGLLYWWPMIHPGGGRRRLRFASLPYVGVTMTEQGLLGGLYTYVDEPLYATYRHAPRVWGLSAVTDQQIAGIIMWAVGGFLYVSVLFVFFFMMALAEERATARAAGRGPSRKPATAGGTARDGEGA